MTTPDVATRMGLPRFNASAIAPGKESDMITVGIDIGKEKHAVAAIGAAGEVLMPPRFFDQNAQGFAALLARLGKLGRAEEKIRAMPAPKAAALRRALLRRAKTGRGDVRHVQDRHAVQPSNRRSHNLSITSPFYALLDNSLSLLDSAAEWAKIGRECLLRAMESTSAGNFATAAEYRRQSDEAFEKELRLRSVLDNTGREAR